jgi:uncharacterized membrane protein YeiH
MAAVMAPRGPDGSGLWLDGAAGLVHRRLAVIDLSERGAQPMRDERHGLAIVFNGCIYNHHELRAELRGLGHDFASTSDTEVLLKGWAEWGEGMLDRLAGMFAFALNGALTAVLVAELDIVGVVTLGMMTALGGGILRDLIIGDTPPAAFTNVNYLVIPLLAAAVTFFAHPLVQRFTFTVLVFDAAGLGLFCVTGTLKALDFHLGTIQAVLLGITTAVGGGVLRDITARETPALVQVDTDLYSIPAAAGAVVARVSTHEDQAQRHVSFR